LALRNPSLKLFGSVVVYPNNVYEITNRNIRPQGANAEVTIFVDVYVDDTKVDVIKQIQFTLTVVNNQTELNPSTYETKLIEQHGSEIIDGTALSSFTVLP
jgi:hypothetical protein